VHLDGHRQLPHAQTSCGEWLVFERHDGAITLMSPLSAAAGTIVLPGLHSLNPDHKDVQVQGPAIRKLVVCSGNLVAAAVVDKPREPYVKLALCRPGSASWSWALVDGANVFARDFVLYQGRLYAFGHDRSLDMVSITADDGEPSVSSVDRVIDSVMRTSPLQPCYLLESGGALLLITETTDTLEGIKLLAPAVAKFAVYVRGELRALAVDDGAWRPSGKGVRRPGALRRAMVFPVCCCRWPRPARERGRKLHRLLHL
jgi:hypothetical protein